jgi:hypothetical protein
MKQPINETAKQIGRRVGRIGSVGS